MKAPSKPAEVGTIRLFDAARVRALPGQPRKRFAGINELAASIKQVGQTSPGQVTLLKNQNGFDAQLIDGERRLRACKVAGVPFRAEIRPDDHPEKIFALSFAANFGKQYHDPVEIAEALERLMAADRTQEEVAAIAGKSQGWVSRHLGLLKLHPSIRKLLIVEEGQTAAKVSMSHAVDLLPLPESLQIKLAPALAKGVGLHRLRRLIDRERKSAGINPRDLTNKSISKLESLTENFLLRLDRYMDLPGADLNRLIDLSDPRTRSGTVEQLRFLAEAAAVLAKAIESRKAGE
jgi:ParB/RepB/Spo0J family partition protein